MSNIVRRDYDRGVGMPTWSGWDPFQMMRELMSWDPFQQLDAATPLIGRMARSFSPTFEVKETPEAFVIRADVPGLEEKDLDVSLTGNRLTISGRREAEQRSEDEAYYAYERSYGAFSRSFVLPDGIDVEHVEGELRNGVLTVHLPKKPEVQPRKIAIKAKGVVEKIKGALGAKEKGSA